MATPEQAQKLPNEESIHRLAERFSLSREHYLQDADYQTPDPRRISEFILAYESEDLTDDERSILMETLLDSFEALAQKEPIAQNSLWQKTLHLLEKNVELHFDTIQYRSCLCQDEGQDKYEDLDRCWRVTPFIRPIFEKYKEHCIQAK
jgi:hypothetical protein